MARLRYRGPEPYVVTMGCSFDAGKWVDAAKLPEGVFERLSTNPTFEADGGPVSPSKSAPSPIDDAAALKAAEAA